MTTKKTTKLKYQLKDKDSWVDVKTATTLGMKEGWLQWDDSEGCTGLSRPGTWRVKPTKGPQETKL